MVGVFRPLFSLELLYLSSDLIMRLLSLDRSSGYGIASPRPIAGLLFPANPDCTKNARHLHGGGTDIALGTHPLPGPSFGPYRYKRSLICAPPVPILALIAFGQQIASRCGDRSS